MMRPVEFDIYLQERLTVGVGEEYVHTLKRLHVALSLKPAHNVHGSP